MFRVLEGELTPLTAPIGLSLVAIRYFNFSVIISTACTLGRPDPLCPNLLRPSPLEPIVESFKNNK